MSNLHLMSVVGKTTLITGASGALGSEIAKAYIEQGQIVTAIGRNSDKLSGLKSLGAKTVEFDMNNHQEIYKFSKDCEPFANIILCHGIHGARPMRMLSNEFSESVIQTNLLSTLNLLSNLIRARKINSPGRVILISSISAHIGSKTTIPYSASKAGAEAAMKGLASDFLHKEITVNSIAPAAILTPLWQTDAPLLREEIYPLGSGMPKDVANACIFLSLEGSKFITGETVILDGGGKWFL